MNCYSTFFKVRKNNMPNTPKYTLKQILQESPSSNYNERGQGGNIQGIIAHYTAANEKLSRQLLEGEAFNKDGEKIEVSAHYLISSNLSGVNPIIFQLVKEEKKHGLLELASSKGKNTLMTLPLI
jgi:N-acetyl-anhydromuramyl-L-alanine amidase AmpD